MPETYRRRRALSLALQRRSAPAEHGADHHRHADRLLRQRRLCRQDGLRHLADARADRADQDACSRDARARASTSSTPARAIGPIWPICPPTSAGARAASAPASAIRARAAACWCAASRAGTSFRRAGAAAGRADHRQAGQGLVLRHRSRADAAPARHQQHRAHRHHHRRVRAHDHARGQRPRLRMPAARGLLRRDRQGQPRPRDQDDQDAGRRVRRGVEFRRIS